jgi:hypothetical protein
MKKFLLTLAVVAFATAAMTAQDVNNNAVQEDPVRIQTRHLSMNPTGNDIPTGYDKPQVRKHEQCQGHKDGEACNKPADQQCDDCKAKAAQQHECKKGEGHECKEGMKPECKKGEGHECKEGMKPECKKGEGHECKEGMKPECKKGEGHECKEGMKPECKKGEGHECKEGMKPECKKGEGHECKEGKGPQCEKAAMMKKHEECKDHKDGQPCTKPADQQCDDCKAKAAEAKKK